MIRKYKESKININDSTPFYFKFGAPKKVTNEIKKNIINQPTYNYDDITDAQGLNKAYENKNKIYTYKNKMYIAGTSSLQDIYDDIYRVPPLGDLTYSPRYVEAKSILDNNDEINHIVGHSLAGSIALELQKRLNNRDLKTTTYGAPVADLNLFNKTFNKNMRYRHPGDIISMFDNKAINITNDNFTLNPLTTHAYNEFGDQGLINGRQYI